MTKSHKRMYIIVAQTVMIIVSIFYLSACDTLYEQSGIQITDNNITGSFISRSGFEVMFDAHLTLYESGESQIVEAKRKALTDNDITSMIHLCLGNEKYQLFKEWNISREGWAKKLARANEYANTEKTTQSYIDWLEDSLKKSSPVVTNTPTDLVDFPSNILNIAYVATDETADEIAKIGFVRNGEFLFAYYRDMFMDIVPESLTGMDQFDAAHETLEQFLRRRPDKPTISQDEAFKTAQKYSNDLGSDLELYLAEPCSILRNSAIDKDTGWMFTFTRSINGLQAIYEDGWTYVNPKAMPVHVSPWASEVLKISVDQTGICSLWWQGATLPQHENVKMVSIFPAGDLPKKISDSLYRIYGSHRNGDGKRLVFEVKTIELGISLISENNDRESAVFIPTWYVFLNRRWQGETEYLASDKLCLSAIDGSYIEPRMSIDDIIIEK